MRRSLRVPICAAVAVTLLVPAVSATAAPAPGVETAGSAYAARESARLSVGLARAVSRAGFDSLVDYDNIVGGVAQPAAHPANVDVAVLELDRAGKVIGAANVLYDRDSPQGYQVGITKRSLRTTGVEFARWRLDRWDDQVKWAAGPDAADVLVSPKIRKKSYLVSYPASVLKLMVGYAVLRLVDQKRLSLATPVAYHEVAGRTCGYGPSNPTGATPAPVAEGARDTVAGWFDKMITVSDNFATCVLLQAVYDKGALTAANKHFAHLGLSTFRMLPSQPEVGNGWSSGTMTMGAFDTAKLLLILNGGPGVLWRTPKGTKVTARELTQRSRKFFLHKLGEQSFNEVLNPVNLCGSSDASAGIPSTVSKRWIDPDTGHVVTYDGDLAIDFGYDVRPCVTAAEVRFRHKTGLTYNAGSDAGIVTALPGQGGRRYIVATFAQRR